MATSDLRTREALSRAGSPIHSAAWDGDAAVLRRELDRGVSVNVPLTEPIEEDHGLTPLIPSNAADRDPYLRRVRANGGFLAHRRRHLMKLARMFTVPQVPNDGRRRSRRLHRRGGGSLERLPPEIVMRVVEFWAHVGHY